eukprot:CAMPEP_0115155494 /NCGR_PEP_ID=MMETSP0227-20121206/67917_1 /TAXON_ID=89957 /ORGANISM="Polarella glacialis, Strain CCMP 1383" /LENGTH=232 /DNA_ID=CAMNT_0002566559 /DNA_START=56 /DNA_END=757 /DNA_ORIENTATION=-
MTLCCHHSHGYQDLRVRGPLQVCHKSRRHTFPAGSVPAQPQQFPATANAAGGAKVMLRVCSKCLGKGRGGGFDPTPTLSREIELRRSAASETTESGTFRPPEMVVESGSCMGPCSDGPNVQLLTEVDGWPTVVVVEGMSGREVIYRCLMDVADEGACRRACDLALQLAAGTSSAPGLEKNQALEAERVKQEENEEQRQERAKRIATELAESRAYMSKREAAAGAANWRDKCR